MRAEAQVLKGHLDMLLLATLETGPRHGYAVREALREASGTRLDLPTGTIYPALRRLEAEPIRDAILAASGRLDPGREIGPLGKARPARSANRSSSPVVLVASRGFSL